MEFKDSTIGYNPNPLSWSAEILEVRVGIIIWVEYKGMEVVKTFTVVHKMPRYLLINHKISFDSFFCWEWIIINNTVDANIIGASKNAQKFGTMIICKFSLYWDSNIGLFYCFPFCYHSFNFTRAKGSAINLFAYFFFSVLTLIFGFFSSLLLSV